ncbi:MAG TPA: tripartite tricarboxylate transporter substrate binding protein [Ramlibacter sp.]|nr:tripartite tricarboxylate transporter substrate binding protein [Ramlibacter sp.]
MKALLWSALCALVLAAAPAAAQPADPWPAKPIRLVIGYPPGGSIDILSRGLAPALSRTLGQPIVVDNKPGAGQTLAAELLAKAEPDGYTIGLIDSGPLTISPHLRPLPFDPFKSFVPVGSIANLPLVIVASNNTGIGNLADLLRVAREKPGALSYASTGAGSMHNLTGEYLKSLQKLDIVHVPYRGTALAVPDLLSGRLSLSITGVSSGGRLVLDKQVQAVGVTSTKRSPALPNVPTLAEQGMAGFDSQGWVGLLAPAGTPPAVVARLGAALREALKDPVLIQQEVTRGGNELLAGTAEELSAMLSRDHARWGRGIKEQGIKGE